MNPVLSGLIKLYEGGELEVQNGTEGYAFRGRIATLAFVEDEHGNSNMMVKLEWMAKADGRRLGGGYVPSNGWDEDTNLEYSCSTDLPSSDLDAPNLPNVMFNMGPDGSMRMIIANPYTGELTVLFPRGGSQLNHANVRWLPDGPKAKADAEREKAQARPDGTNNSEN